MGFWTLGWLQWLGVTFLMTHITIVAVTLYLHRSQAHRAIDLHPVLCHVFRLWLWLTTGMNTREWVAVHRKHHAYVETPEDPHSPKVYGILMVLFNGVGLYKRAAESSEILEKYGAGTPNDFLENNVYSVKNLGVVSMLIIDVLCFGWKTGFLTWGVQMLWIPLLAAGVINGVGHYIGYRNYQPVDDSKNIVPWGILIGGEELHNNHHAYPRSAKFSSRPFEFDIGYVYIKLLKLCRLAKINYVLPNLSKDCFSGVKGILNARMGIYREFQRSVTTTVLKQNLKTKKLMKGLKLDKIILVHPNMLKEAEKQSLQKVLSVDAQIEKVYQLQLKLYGIFYENRSQNLVEQVKLWCQEAKASHQQVLLDFVAWLEEHFLNQLGEKA